MERQASEVCRQRVIDATEVVKRQVIDSNQDSWQARLLRHGSVQPIKKDAPVAPSPKELSVSERLKLSSSSMYRTSLTSIGQFQQHSHVNAEVERSTEVERSPPLVESPARLSLSPSAMSYISTLASPPAAEPCAPVLSPADGTENSEYTSPILESTAQEDPQEDLAEQQLAPEAQPESSAEDVRAQLAQIHRAVLGSNPIQEPSPSRL